jgi:hypothetical protein
LPSVDVVVDVEVEVSVIVELSGVVEVLVDVELGCVVVDDVVLDDVVVVEDVVDDVVAVEDEVVVSSPLSLATTASATPRPITTAIRIAISAFMPPLIPFFGGSPGGCP